MREAHSTSVAALRHRPTARAPVVGRATTSTSPSARATCRPRRCSSRSPTRRSPTAARVVRPHLGHAGRGRAAARVLQRIEPTPAPPASTIDPAYRQAIMDGLHARRHRAGRHLRRRLRAGFPRTPVYGKTGTAERGRTAPTSPGTSAYVPDTDASRSWSPSTVEQGGFGAEAAAPAARLILVAVVRRQKASCTPGSSKTTDERAAQPIQPASETVAAPRAARPPAAVRPAAAARGRSGSSPARWSRSSGATRDDIAGQPALLRRAPGGLRRRRRSCSMLVLARIDYSRLRELKLRALRRC